MVFLFPRLSAASLPRRRMTARRAIAKHIAKIQPLPHPTKFPQGINIEFVKLNTQFNISKSHNYSKYLPINILQNMKYAYHHKRVKKRY